MTDIVKGPITVPDEAPMLFAENIQLRFENERLGRDYQAARDAHDKLLAENERFKISLSDTVQQTQEQRSEITALRAEVERLGKDYQSARDAHDMLLAENEKIIATLWEILDKPRDADKSYAELFIDVIYEVRALLRKR